MLIAFNNGVYDITNGEFRLGICEDFLSMKLNYDYNLVQDSNEKMIFLDRMLDDILGDKLTAFAPNTTGIPYEKSGLSRAMEIIKQLYDIGNLFEQMASPSAGCHTS